MAELRYQDFVDELLRGESHGVFIDDTGFAGHDVGNPDLHPQRKTWVAVLVPRWHMHEVLTQFREALEGLRSIVGPVSEFHFAHIYTGKGKFRRVPMEVRLGLFDFMAFIFREYAFPILVQTHDPDSLAHLRARKRFPHAIGPFDLSKPSDASLLMLLIRVQWYLQEHWPSAPARVFVDEGFEKKGRAISLPTFADVFAGGLVCFADSCDIQPIQLADFAAYMLNRTQMLMKKKHLPVRDAAFLEIASKIASNFVNLGPQVITIESAGIQIG